MNRKRILHVEDTIECQQLVQAVLTFYGYEVLTAKNGAEGVAMAKSACPDVILMDLHLPVFDGLEATRQLRSMPETAFTPIIALTASDEQVDYERSLAAGCTAYMSKPFSPSELVDLICQYQSTPA
jgi:two-component system cell cycle response regulator DivK